MGFTNSRARKWAAGALAGVTLSAAAALGGFAVGAGAGEGPEIAEPKAGQVIGDRGGGGEPAEGAGGHAEGNGAGGENGREVGSEGAEANPTHAEGAGEGGSAEINEALMSSPVVPLDQTWTGNLGGLDVAASYDTATQTVRTTVHNTTSQTLCYVQSEPHMKLGAQTVGELGPQRLGDLAPGQSATSVLSVVGEPSMAGVPFDGYVVHMEVFDCNGPGAIPHSGGEGSEGAEGAGGHAEGNEAGGERGGEVTEAGGENDTAVALTPNQTYDVTRNGARLRMVYDPATNTFRGTVTNTTNSVLTRARVEIHLSNGAELGPTTPTDLAPGQTIRINLPATQAPFATWSPHAEVGNAEAGESGAGGGEGAERAGGHAEGNEGGAS